MPWTDDDWDRLFKLESSIIEKLATEEQIPLDDVNEYNNLAKSLQEMVAGELSQIEEDKEGEDDEV